MDKEQMKRLIELLRDGGAEDAEVRLTRKMIHSVDWGDDETRMLSTAATATLGIKAKIKGYIVRNEWLVGSDTRPEMIAQALLAQEENAQESGDDLFAPAVVFKSRDVHSAWDAEGAMAYLRALSESYRKLAIELRSALLTYTLRQEQLYSMRGADYTAESDGWTLTATSIMEDACGKQDSNMLHISFHSLQEGFFPDPKDPMVQYRALLQEARSVEPFKGTLVIAPTCLYYFMMDFLFSQLFETALTSSAWKNSFGQRVMDEGFTARLDPTHPCMVLGEQITQDNLPARGYDLLCEGVLKNGVLGCAMARQLQLPASGNGGDNLILNAGESSLFELIAGIEQGLLMYAFDGESGSPDGSFFGVAKQCFQIEKGRIVGAVEGLSIRGNWFDVLASGKFACSKERIASGESLLPYMAIRDVSFA